MPGVLSNALAGRLQRVQSGQEVTWGTPVVASARWMAIQPTPTFTPMYKSVLVDEDRGSLAESYLSYVPELGGQYSLKWDTATFEDILFALHGTMGAVSPSGGGPYVYTYNAPLTSAWSPQSYTLELAYDIGTIAAQGVLTNKLTINMNAKKNWTIDQSGFFQQLQLYPAVNIASSTNANPIVVTTSSPHNLPSSGAIQVVIVGHTINTNANGTWTATYVSPTTFSIPATGNGIGGATGTVTRSVTPGIADRVVEPVLFAGETALYCENAAGTPGTTPVPNAFVSGKLEIDNALQGFYTGDQKYPVDFTYDKFKVTFTPVLKWNAQVKALYDTQWTQGNRTVFQVKATSGAKSVVLNFAGVLTNDPQNYKLDYAALTQELQFSAQYDSGTLANYLQAIVTNQVSALP